MRWGLGKFFQKALSVLLFIACLFLFIAGYLSKSTDNTPAIRLWAWGSFLASVAFAAWHIWATSSKRNIYPDVLSMIFDPKVIFEAGGIQLSFLMFQVEEEIRIATIVQNMHDSITTIQVNFALQFGKNATRIALPSLKHDLGSSEVTLAQYRFPLSAAQMQKQFAKITPSIKTKVTRRAPVRFDKRQVFDTKTKPWLSFLMLAGHVAVFGGGKFFTLRLSPVAIESKCAPSPQWELHTLWTPISRRSTEEIVNIINSETLGVSEEKRWQGWGRI